MQSFCKAVAGSELFQGFILALIVFNALCMGAEATPGFAAAYATALDLIFVASQAIFVAEIAIRLGTHWPRPGQFFREFWNTFDFTVVALSLVPAVGGFTLVARVLRVLRLVRLFSASTRLRGFFEGVRESLPVLALATIVLLVLGYIFALAGFYLFGEALPAQWGSLGRAVLSVAQLMLLQDLGAALAPLYALARSSLLYVLALYFAQFAVLANALAAAASARSRDP
jgi:voltage-gated sodium channel